MNRDELKTFSLNIMEKAKRNLCEDGHLMPVLFFRDRDKTIHIVGLEKLNDDVKERLPHTIKQYVKELGADVVIFISDTYVTLVNPKTGHPGRKSEAISLSASTPSDNYFVWIPYSRAKAKHTGTKEVFVFKDPVEYRVDYNRFLDGLWEEPHVH